MIKNIIFDWSGREQIISLLQNLKQQNTVLVYLHAPLNTLLKRACEVDAERLVSNYSALTEMYESTVNLVSQYIPVVRIDSGKNISKQIFSQLMGFEIPERIE